MEKTYQAKTIEEAVEQACKDLGLTSNQFSHEVVELGSKGFLGIGAKEAVIKVTYTPDACACIRTYLEGLFELLGVHDAAIDITSEGDAISVQVTGDEANMLMKNRGEGVDALQLLLSLVVNRDCGEYYKISFNINDYKEKTEERLEALALKTAAQVVKNRRKMTLPPMTSFQRRIIHSKLQDYKDVTTYSVGEDPSRRVVISYCGADGPAPRAEGASRTGDRSARPNTAPRRDGDRPFRSENRAPRDGANRSYGNRDNNRGGYSKRPFDANRRPMHREDAPAGETIVTGEITHLPGEKLSGAAAKNPPKPQNAPAAAPAPVKSAPVKKEPAKAEPAGSSASPVSGGTPFTMGGKN